MSDSLLHSVALTVRKFVSGCDHLYTKQLDFTGLTELLAGLDEGNRGILSEEGNGPVEEVRLGLEVRVEDGNVLAARHVS